MAPSTISNVSVAASQIGQQKAFNGREQAQGQGTSLLTEGGFSGKQADDTISLRTSGKQVGQAKVLQTTDVEQVLPRAMAAIINESKIALAAQATISSQTAQEMLSDR